MGKLGVFLCILSIIAGLYFLNSGFDNAAKLPSIITNLDVPLRLIGGALLIAGGFCMTKLGKKKEAKTK